MILLHYMFEQIRAKGYLDSADRLWNRDHTSKMNKEEARKALQLLVCLFVLPEVECPVEPRLRRRMVDSLEYGTIVDDLCDLLRSEDPTELSATWKSTELIQRRERHRHLQQVEELRLYRSLRTKAYRKCKAYFDKGLLQATYPELEWDDCAKYVTTTWGRFQPDRMPAGLRSAFVYATRNVPTCRDQNEEWINRKVRRQMQWWMGRRPLPTHHSI